MVKFINGEVVAIEISKGVLRPVLIVAIPDETHRVVCQITAEAGSTRRKLELTQEDFVGGGLPVNCYVQLERLSTINIGQIKKSLGLLNTKYVKGAKLSIIRIFALPVFDKPTRTRWGLH